MDCYTQIYRKINGLNATNITMYTKIYDIFYDDQWCHYKKGLKYL